MTNRAATPWLMVAPGALLFLGLVVLPLTLTAIERLIREAEADVAELKAQQTELVAEAAAEVEAQAERQRKEAALRELQKLEAETKEKTKALRSELGLN